MWIPKERYKKQGMDPSFWQGKKRQRQGQHTKIQDKRTGQGEWGQGQRTIHEHTRQEEMRQDKTCCKSKPAPPFDLTLSLLFFSCPALQTSSSTLHEKQHRASHRELVPERGWLKKYKTCGIMELDNECCWNKSESRFFFTAWQHQTLQMHFPF